ncbi:hypothetical protein ACRALDRAFT_2016243 [Sodiomyces alcalophilus JCM 7366]|uniref:uncharacterized protein n=1 Tax=Sodiomyces alcalophilus JCM 7366 TaxID=591952 RepID=UPI0039B568A1
MNRSFVQKLYKTPQSRRIDPDEITPVGGCQQALPLVCSCPQEQKKQKSCLQNKSIHRIH